MKIVRVSATPLNLPVTVPMANGTKSTSLSVCIVQIETDTGLVGTGMTATWATRLHRVRRSAWHLVAAVLVTMALVAVVAAQWRRA